MAIAGHLDDEIVGQSIDNGYANAVQTAGCLIDIGIEFAARMQGRHDDFERRLVLEFWMRIDRYAAAVVGDAEIAVCIELNIDVIGMPSDGFIHRIVDDFGKQMVQRAHIGTADIHAGASTHRLKAFENFDVRGRIVAFGCGLQRLCCTLRVGIAFNDLLDAGGFLLFRRRGALDRFGRYQRRAKIGKEIVAVIH